MKDISLHILDIVQNSLHAGATQIHVSVTESRLKNILILEIRDNGKGIDVSLLDKIIDPFYTTGKKKVGMGLALLKQNAEMAGGSLELKSLKTGGLLVKASFMLNHIDCPPIGEINETVKNIFFANPDLRFIYEQIIDNKKIKIDTDEINEAVDGLDMQNKETRAAIKEYIYETLKIVANC